MASVLDAVLVFPTCVQSLNLARCIYRAWVMKGERMDDVLSSGKTPFV